MKGIFRQLLAVSVAALVLACGSTASNQSTPQGSGGAGGVSSGSSGSATTSGAGGAPSGGANGNGGNATGGSASSGGTSGQQLSTTEACILYARTACARLLECQGRSESCDFAAAECPDQYFSDGSPRTAESVTACAAEYATFPCEKLLAGESPACVLAGTRQVGEACLYSSQCASLSCDSPDEMTCGKCRPSAKVGEACAPDGATCPRASACVDGKCAPPPIRRPLELGAACVPPQVCKGGACKDGFCVALPSENTACSPNDMCPSGLYCEQSSRLCKKPPPSGDTCLTDVYGSDHCATGSCRVQTYGVPGTCGDYAQLNDTCFVFLAQDKALYPLKCEPGTYCKGGVDAVCSPQGALNADCATDPECEDGLTCICPADNPMCGQGDRHICGKVGFTGDACSPTGSPCHPGFNCNANVCVPKESQGLFANVCK